MGIEDLRDALVDLKVGLQDLKDALAKTERDLTAERQAALAQQ